MEYEQVVGKLKKLSSRSEEDVENLLGYLYYEEEASEDLLPVEYEDMEELIERSNAVKFALCDAETLRGALDLCMEQIGFSKSQNINTMIVKFITGPDFDIDEVYETFSPLEFGMNSSSETAVLVAATRDEDLHDQAIAIVIIASEGEF